MEINQLFVTRLKYTEYNIKFLQMMATVETFKDIFPFVGSQFVSNRQHRPVHHTFNNIHYGSEISFFPNVVLCLVFIIN